GAATIADSSGAAESERTRGRSLSGLIEHRVFGRRLDGDQHCAGCTAVFRFVAARSSAGRGLHAEPTCSRGHFALEQLHGCGVMAESNRGSGLRRLWESAGEWISDRVLFEWRSGNRTDARQRGGVERDLATPRAWNGARDD